MLDTLLIHGQIVTQDKFRRVISDGMVGIAGSRIALVAPMDGAPLPQARRVVDCTGKIILPGLIDGHGHAGHPMTKLISTDSLSYWGRCAERIYFFWSTPEFWYYDGLLGGMERLRYGVTTGINVIANEPRADSLEIVESHAKGYTQTGARTIICTGPGSNNWPKPLARWDGQEMKRTTATWEEYMENTEALLNTLHLKQDGLERVFVTPFTIVPSIPTWGKSMPEVTDRLTQFDRMQQKAVVALAKKYKTNIHTDAFGNGIELMSRSDDPILGENVLLQHCYDLNWREVQLVAQTGTNIGHSPEQSNHFCPFTELLEAGANAFITSDAPGPRVTFDMFEHMRRAQDLEELRFGDYHTLSAQELLDCVTTKAAKAVGMAGEIGSLQEGFQADVIILDGAAPHLMGSRPLLEKCVYAASGLDVETVYVNGRLAMEGRRVLGVDESAAVAKADQVAKDAARAAGLEAFIHQEPVFGNPYQIFFDTPINFPAL